MFLKYNNYNKLTPPSTWWASIYSIAAWWQFPISWTASTDPFYRWNHVYVTINTDCQGEWQYSFEWVKTWECQTQVWCDEAWRANRREDSEVWEWGLIWQSEAGRLFQSAEWLLSGVWLGDTGPGTVPPSCQPVNEHMAFSSRSDARDGGNWVQGAEMERVGGNREIHLAFVYLSFVLLKREGD